MVSFQNLGFQSFDFVRRKLLSYEASLQSEKVALLPCANRIRFHFLLLLILLTYCPPLGCGVWPYNFAKLGLQLIILILYYHLHKLANLLHSFFKCAHTNSFRHTYTRQFKFLRTFIYSSTFCSKS